MKKKMSGMPPMKKGHKAHMSMGLPKGNPLAGGGNSGRRRGSGRRAAPVRRRSGY